MPFSNPFSGHPAATVAPLVEYAEFQKTCAEGGCAIVDVREPHEYSAGHIPGAINLPLSSFDPAHLPRDDIVLVCQSGARSATALRRALEAGVQGITHYPEGTSGWRRHGGAIEV